MSAYDDTRNPCPPQWGNGTQGNAKLSVAKLNDSVLAEWLVHDVVGGYAATRIRGAGFELRETLDNCLFLVAFLRCGELGGGV